MTKSNIRLQLHKKKTSLRHHLGHPAPFKISVDMDRNTTPAHSSCLANGPSTETIQFHLYNHRMALVGENLQDHQMLGKMGQEGLTDMIAW